MKTLNISNYEQLGLIFASLITIILLNYTSKASNIPPPSTENKVDVIDYYLEFGYLMCNGSYC
jgi:hypothetical protein